MNRRDASRYARWSALLALALAGLTGAIYAHRLWVAHREKQNAPTPLPQNEEKQFTTLHFKKVEGNRTIFDLEASKSTDLRGQDISLLEDVKIKVFGKNGDRNDVIHTQSCRYAKTDGGIQCDGKVQFELQSAEDAARAAANPGGRPNIIHIDTSEVTFERATGRAQTVQLVKFSFPNGKGDGIGAVYQSERGLMRLIRDVHILMQPAAGAPAKKTGTVTQPVEMSGSSMEIDKVGHTVQLAGPATATSAGQQVTAGQFTLLLDAEFRAQTLIGAPGSLNQRPEVKNHGSKGDSTLQADKLTAQLAPQGWTSRIIAEGKVQGNSPSGNLEAESGDMEMWPGVNQAKLLTLRGNVRLQEAERNGEAQQAVFARAAQTTVLAGQAMVRDAGSETHAPKITFYQSTGEIEAEGPVRSTDFASKGTSLQMSSVPANLSADRMRANSKTGRAVYTGHARLWQGASVLEAETIELLRPSRILNATGNVRAVFPQAPQPGASLGSAPVWHISSGQLTYWDTENRAHLEKDVYVQSADQKMHAPQLELFFTRNGSDKQGNGGTSQISRAVGTGGVMVEQGDRRGTAERGLDNAAEEKNVRSGGTPTLIDPVEGTTTGRELTFYRGDDTIVVDSGNGLRTLTKHRVQR